MEDLPDIGRPGCDLAFSAIVFEGDYFDYGIAQPGDGGRALVEVEPIGHIGGVLKVVDGRHREMLIVNWGVPGVGVASIEDGKLRAVWATSPEAEKLQYRQLEIQRVEFD